MTSSLTKKVKLLLLCLFTSEYQDNMAVEGIPATLNDV